MQTEPPKADQPKRKRRWLQFSLRLLLIGTVVVAVAAGWLGRSIERKRRQLEVVNTILKDGGVVFYDYGRQEIGGWTKGREPSGPSWLRAILGENFFSEVEMVGLDDHSTVTDADIPRLKQELKELPHLKYFDVARSKITRDGVEDLKQALPNCKVLTNR
jgi:hypothetical protein